MRRVVTPLILLVFGPTLVLSADPPKPTAEQIEFFEKSVRPILAEQCYSCHGAKKQQAGLRLDTSDATTKGATDGPVIVPGELDKSRFIQSVRRKGDNPMPPDSELSKEQVATLEQWVKMGALYPATATPTAPGTAKPHWAFQPVSNPSIPANPGRKGGGIPNPIDAFVDAKIAANKLTPAPRADKRALARRVYFDLIGLPPTADEIDAFANDPDSNAYEKLIDRLLANPHYGERWARYWMDVARYADSKGYVFTEDRNYPYAYTYRDYLIRSFNDDKPFDQFVVEQLAADKLPNADKAALAAMGFLTVGRRFSNNIHDITDDRIDVVTRGLMGLTVSCARCHDHKFDPVPTADYYSLYGVFASSNEPKDLPQIGDAANQKEFQKFQADLAKLEQAVADERTRRIEVKKKGLYALAGGTAVAPNPDKLINRADRNEIGNFQRKADEFKAKSPGAPPRAMVMTDNPKPAEQVVFLRGNSNNRGPKVPRQMPAVVAGANRKPFTDGSGRLEMAKAIASKDNPLTARVFVNRIWTWHFGQGLVRTPSDFGLRADPPTHPELLDWLTSRFLQDGWSVKKLHKRIMLSEAYTRSSITSPQAALSDAENLWLSHQNRKRHDFETMRDSLLAVSGQLDPTVLGRSVDLFKPPFSKRRSLYGYIDRQNLPGTLRAFDFASPEQHTPQRFVTTVPQQALYMMNSPFAAEAARAVAKRDEVTKATEQSAKVKALYRLILSRDPTNEEAELAVSFVTVAEQSDRPLGHLSAWEQFAQVLLLSNEFAFAD